MKDKIRILSVSKPAGDMGPAVGYKNHIRALENSRFSITELTQEIWDTPGAFDQFDVAWAYVRFAPEILQRCQKIGMPFVGGPNIVMERADIGITDTWERWYLEQSGVDVNLNVAEYYTTHVKQFAKGIKHCETLEYCYELEGVAFDGAAKSVDCLVYVKDRINDGLATEIAKKLLALLKDAEMSYEMLIYGSYTRSEYLKILKNSKTTAWISIEDYCSLAQTESNLLGSCVVGTKFNLTAPTFDEALCNDSQIMQNWVRWNDPTKVANDYFSTISKLIKNENLAKLTYDRANERHSYQKYCTNVEAIFTQAGFIK